MDPAVKELAELVGRVLAERWLKQQKENGAAGKRNRKMPSAGTTHSATPPQHREANRDR